MYNTSAFLENLPGQSYGKLIVRKNKNTVLFKKPCWIVPCGAIALPSYNRVEVSKMTTAYDVVSTCTTSCTKAYNIKYEIP
ncbi:hypothetical protein WN51_08043 [Melipona quadrifasciata]|uniref:Uncharacterized protein n=1 Tax=Melipona quadrifasciata TaxID=166423 RepID=A0A0N0U2X1_9HYME|nr:hypothetical protein WN51_08043 [Melipona quadrifasciata]